MEKKAMMWKTKGMNRDISVSAFSSEFSYENLNLRLATNNNNTTMSWVNEKGTLELGIKIDTKPWLSGEHEEQDVEGKIEGIVIGTAVLNHNLVLFTTDEGVDRIYVLEYSEHESEPALLGVQLYKGHLNFSTEYPLETLVSYEAEHVQKVYWTDNYNQPRLINIAADEDKLKIWNHVEETYEGIDTFFDFIPAFQMNEEVTIQQDITGGGIFAPGVIQYAFTYINNHGQQSNIVYVSPLYYLAFEDRGASPEETVTCSFDIKITGLDTSFDYVRLYSIQRTSLNLDVYVKLLEDLPIADGKVSYIDNGTTGSALDPFELLFVGGKAIKALTMAEKDKTLFMGNIEETNESVEDIQNFFDDLRNDSDIDNHVKFTFDTTLRKQKQEHVYDYYGHTQTTKYNSQELTTFKGGENYRFGFQMQKTTGEWSEPVWIDDKTIDVYPNSKMTSDNVGLVTVKANIPVDKIDLSKFKKIRPLVVYPSISDRKILCQGVINPTVFNANDRKDNSPFAQASWYYRPYTPNIEDSGGIDIPTTWELGVSVEGEGVFTTEYPKPTDNYDNDADDIYAVLLWTYSSEAGQRNILDTLINRGKIYYEKTVEEADTLEDLNGKTGTYISTSDIIGRKFGIVKLRDSSNVESALYAFVCIEGVATVVGWPVPGEGEVIVPDGVTSTKYRKETYRYDLNSIPDGTGSQHLSVNEAQSNIRVSCMRLAIGSPSGLRLSRDKFIYYVKEDGSSMPDPYESTYYDNIHETSLGYNSYRFTITFKAVDIESEEEDVYISDSLYNGGTSVLFKHFESLATDNESKQQEIQGASPAYNIFDSPSKETKPNNTQFFIDHSIVTFNSPDIEFDTDVQTFGVESNELTLHIVGAIPITASASSHRIIASSNLAAVPDSFGYSMYGKGETSVNAFYKNISTKAGNKLVADYLWNDGCVYIDEDGYHALQDSFYDFMVYPWHRTGSLNSDTRPKDGEENKESDAYSGKATSWLDIKKESNLQYSLNTEYFGTSKWSGDTYTKIHLGENGNIINIRLHKQLNRDTTPNINYYPNIDKVLHNSNGYYPAAQGLLRNADVKQKCKLFSPISMKYKSNTHAVVAIKGDNDSFRLLPYGQMDDEWVGNYTEGTNGNETFWGDTYAFTQSCIDLSDYFDGKKYSWLWLGELRKEPSNPFGGTTREAIRNNTWVIGGEPVDIAGDNIELTWTEGDTYYQRYDSLKTYAYNQEDPNQIVEILSFMCETHVNIDGRYDKNRGQIKNYDMRPDVFNLWNPVYSQRNNYFNYKQLKHDKKELHRYPNNVYYTKTKTAGADIDLWTNVTLSSILELDGDKGELNKLVTFNDQILAFQDTGISQVMYNENMQISTTNGVPIEIANSGKVQGARYITNNVGCSNKWSVVSTPLGIYFIDSNNKSIYMFNGQMENISLKGGMNTWVKLNVPASSVKWNPKDFDNFVAYYDKLNQEVQFINKETSLAFSEKTGSFTSFYSYGEAPYFCNLDDIGIWAKDDKLWKHQAGEYCTFFGGSPQPYSMTLIANADPHRDKIFSNLEFRANIDGDVAVIDGKPESFYLPFTKIDVWDEYQHGVASLGIKNSKDGALHHLLNNDASLKRNFRIWRCDIPRDNAPLGDDDGLNIKRFRQRPLDRMRNPWMYMKLIKDDNTANRTEIHDIIMTYFM